MILTHKFIGSELAAWVHKIVSNMTQPLSKRIHSIYSKTHVQAKLLKRLSKRFCNIYVSSCTKTNSSGTQTFTKELLERFTILFHAPEVDQSIGSEI